MSRQSEVVVQSGQYEDDHVGDDGQIENDDQNTQPRQWIERSLFSPVILLCSFGVGATILLFLIEAGKQTDWEKINILHAVGSVFGMYFARLGSHGFLLLFLNALFVAAFFLLEYYFDQRNFARGDEDWELSQMVGEKVIRLLDQGKATKVSVDRAVSESFGN